MKTSPALRFALLALLAVPALGCRDAVPALGPNLATARAAADEFFYSIGSRFTNIQREPRLVHARSQFGRYALTPSGVFNDSSVWLASGSDSSRLFGNEGVFATDRYIVKATLSNTLPNALTESREIVRLRKLAESEYEWYTNVDVALGRMRAQDLSSVFARILASGEGKSPAAIRADYNASLPRTVAALGRLFTIDTLKAVHDAEGATTYDIAIRLTPATLKSTMPHYAAYIDKYISKGRYRLTLTDRTGARWLEAHAADYYVHFKLRSKGGRFAPLDGGVREMPKALTITLDMSMRVMVFRVGWTEMIGEFNIIDTPNERGWAMRFAKEPEWRLPPSVGRLLKSPLRRPFQGNGIPIRFSIRDTPGAQTLMNRRLSLVVRESGILRFLNRLSGTAVGDFLGASEREANRFNADAFRSLRADVAALFQSGVSTSAGPAASFDKYLTSIGLRLGTETVRQEGITAPSP